MKTSNICLSIIFTPLLITGCKSDNEPKPNILFCIADDVTWKHMGAYGCDWVETPGFNYVAENGVLFSKAYTSNAKSAPSRASILTGRNSWQLEEACNHWPYYPEKFKSFMEVLDDNNFHVGYTGKGYAPGIVAPINNEPRSLTGKKYSRIKMEVPATGISTIDYTSNFIEFLEQNNNNEAFCFWYGGFEPHRNYEYKSGMNAGKNLSDINKVPDFWPDNDSVRNDLLDYAFEIEWFDFHLMQMIKELKERNLFDNTVIIVTADNGMPFPRVKGQAYEYSNHLPLAIMWGSKIKNPGRIVDDYINFSDFAPSILELAGINGEENGMQKIWGKSIVEHLITGKGGIIDPNRDHILIGKERHDVGRPNDWGYPIRGIIKSDFLFIKNFEPSRWPSGNPECGYLNCDGSPTKSVVISARMNTDLRNFWMMNLGPRPGEEFYDLKNDPYCINNLISDGQHSELIKNLRSQMITELSEQSDPRIIANGSIFDKYLYAHKKHKGFYENFMRGEKLNAGWVNSSDFEEDFYQTEASFKLE